MQNVFTIQLFLYHLGPAVSPSSIEVPSWSAKSITISWSRPDEKDLNGELVGFMIRVNASINVNTTSARAKRGVIEVSQVYNASKDDTSFTLENLIPATRYSLEVAAATDAGVGPYSKPVYQTTGEDGV